MLDSQLDAIQRAPSPAIHFANPPHVGKNSLCRQCGADDGTTVHFDLRRGKQWTSELLCRRCATAVITELISYPMQDEILDFFRVFSWGREPMPMTDDERTTMMTVLEPQQLSKDPKEATYRYTLLALLADLSANVAAMARAQREQLRLIQAREARLAPPAAPAAPRANNSPQTQPPASGGRRA